MLLTTSCLGQWTICSRVRCCKRSTVRVSASARLALLALWCVAATTAQWTANWSLPRRAPSRAAIGLPSGFDSTWKHWENTVTHESNASCVRQKRVPRDRGALTAQGSVLGSRAPGFPSSSLQTGWHRHSRTPQVRTPETPPNPAQRFFRMAFFLAVCCASCSSSSRRAAGFGFRSRWAAFSTSRWAASASASAAASNLYSLE